MKLKLKWHQGSFLSEVGDNGLKNNLASDSWHTWAGPLLLIVTKSKNGKWRYYNLTHQEIDFPIEDDNFKAVQFAAEFDAQIYFLQGARIFPNIKKLLNIKELI